MDAQVAYGFHHLRNEKPYLASGPISNKVSMEMWNVFYKLPSCLLACFTLLNLMLQFFEGILFFFFMQYCICH